MKALVLTNERTLALAERPKPTVARPTDVVVRVVQTGICGTDRSVLVGKFPAQPGVVMGHEAVGVVDQVGPEVGELAPGDRVTVSPWLVNRHRSLWTDPDLFIPERFSPEHEADRPRFAYMPFAAGPRHCIGETLALYEMLMHLYKMARGFRLVFLPDNEPLQLEAQINLRTRNPLFMRLERR